MRRIKKSIFFRFLPGCRFHGSRGVHRFAFMCTAVEQLVRSGKRCVVLIYACPVSACHFAGGKTVCTLTQISRIFPPFHKGGKKKKKKKHHVQPKLLLVAAVFRVLLPPLIIGKLTPFTISFPPPPLLFAIHLESFHVYIYISTIVDLHVSSKKSPREKNRLPIPSTACAAATVTKTPTP